MVKRITQLCVRMDLRLFPEWIPRKENAEADFYSKLFSARWRLQPSVLRELNKALGVSVSLPEYNTIRNFIKRVVAAGATAAVVVPKWPAQSWWAFLSENFVCLPLDRSFFVPIPNLGAQPPWDMLLAVRRP